MPIDSPELILTPLSLYIEQIMESGGIIWINDLRTFLLWLRVLGDMCSWMVSFWKVNSRRWEGIVTKQALSSGLTLREAIFTNPSLLLCKMGVRIELTSYICF